VTAANIVITGLPGAGKTTLANRLHELTGWPLFSLDALKESLADEYLTSGLELPVTSDVLTVWAARQVADLAVVASPCIIEGFLAGAEARDRLKHVLRESIEVFCDCDFDVAWSRFSDRAACRPAPHPDATIDYAQFRRDLEALRGNAPLNVPSRGRVVLRTDRVVTDAQCRAIIKEAHRKLGGTTDSPKNRLPAFLLRGGKPHRAASSLTR
jgi:predicted kinase